MYAYIDRKKLPVTTLFRAIFEETRISLRFLTAEIKVSKTLKKISVEN
jgi:hypothetical protein